MDANRKPGLESPRKVYRGRIAPSPTGYLHLGHARTFWIAQERALAEGGILVLRNEDLDRTRCRAEWVAAMLEDLKWIGIQWQEGLGFGGAARPYNQSERLPLYQAAFEQLKAGGFIYPCCCSRRDVLRAQQAPHMLEDEPLYPGTCRPAGPAGSNSRIVSPAFQNHEPRVNWRFRVLDGDEIAFVDGRAGSQSFTAGQNFGDFIVWREGWGPSYQLAVVVDDAAMRITEVVRGADLLLSTARQLLIYRALGLTPPAFYHCPLLTDAAGVRLAKRHDALSLRALRTQGSSPAELRSRF